MSKKKTPRQQAKPQNPWPERLCALRAELGLTQAKAAERAAAPLGTWRGWEYGRRQPSPMIARLLELAFPEFDFANKKLRK